MIRFYLSRMPCAIVTLMLLCVGGGTLMAQDTSARASGIFTGAGLIVDAYGNPIAGVIVRSSDDSLTATNDDGFFDLTIAADRTLNFEHPEFYAYELALRDAEYIPMSGVDSANNNVTRFFTVKLFARLLQNARSIDVLYGTVERGNSIGAVSTITTSQLSTTPAPTIAYALEGRLPGLFLSQGRGFRNPVTEGNSQQDLAGNIPKTFLGAPNDNTEFFLTLRGQYPVVVIDGVQRDIYSIDPENVESVSVLKDALSTNFLGMRSSRGVLLITTKRPNAEGFRLSFTGQIGVQTPLRMPSTLSSYQYAYLLNEALQNDGKTPIYTADDFAAFRSGSDPTGHPDVNWYNTIMRDNAPLSSYNLNVGGGGKVARYSVSASYMDQQGLFKTSSANAYQTNSELKRYLINSSVAINVTDNFLIDLSLFGRIQDGVQPGVGMNALLGQVVSTPNNAYPVYNPNGSYGGNVSFITNLKARAINSGYILDNSRDAIANVGLHYDFNRMIKGFTVHATTNISTQNITSIIRDKQNTVFEYSLDDDGTATYTQYGTAQSQRNLFVPVSTSRFWYAQLSADYKRTFGSHGIDVKLLIDQRVVTVNYDLPQKPANLSARAQYDFEKKYFIDASFTRSYYNGYAEGRQWGSFYAMGAGWNIANEKFFNVDGVDELKLRGVYGKTGSGIDNSGYYIFRQTYSQTFLSGTYDQGFGRSVGSGMSENAPLANPNITWEKADKVDVGIDLSIMNRRLQFTVDYYRDSYYDLLQERGKSIALIGFSYPDENIGKTLYKGLELSLTYQNNIGNFNYFVTGNWSRMSSEIVFQDEQKRQYEYNKVTGLPVGYMYGYVADGLFATEEEVESSAMLENVPVQPGDIKYKDLNNDGQINQYDQTVIGNTKPIIFYGVTAGFNFKGFDVSVLVQGVENREMYMHDNVRDAGFQASGQSYSQAFEQIIGRWTPETAATATYPRLTAGNNVNNTQTSSFWVRSGDYVRVKNLSIAYTLPFKLSNRFDISQVKFFVNGQNLFTRSTYKNTDPEVNNFTNYPIMRVISAGLNIKL